MTAIDWGPAWGWWFTAAFFGVLAWYHLGLALVVRGGYRLRGPPMSVLVVVVGNWVVVDCTWSRRAPPPAA